MARNDTIAQTVRIEVQRHVHSVVHVGKAARSIARRHNCPNDILIRRAILQRLKELRRVAQL